MVSQFGSALYLMSPLNGGKVLDRFMVFTYLFIYEWIG